MTKAKLKLYIYCKYRVISGRGDKQDELTIREVENYIYTVPDTIIRQVLTERYIYGKKWEDVARSIGITSDSCRKMADRYLAQLVNSEQ